MAPIKVGLMGYGFSTKCFHLPFITPNADLEVYAFLQRAEAPADKKGIEAGKHCTVDYPEAKHYRTSDEFFADSEIELVIVCTSSDNHAEFAEKAMRSGKHGKIALLSTRWNVAPNHLLRSRRRKALHHNLSRSRRPDKNLERNWQTPHRLPKPPLRL